MSSTPYVSSATLQQEQRSGCNIIKCSVDDFQLLDSIGQGTFSTLYKAKLRQNNERTTLTQNTDHQPSQATQASAVTDHSTIQDSENAVSSTASQPSSQDNSQLISHHQPEQDDSDLYAMKVVEKSFLVKHNKQYIALREKQALLKLNLLPANVQESLLSILQSTASRQENTHEQPSTEQKIQDNILLQASQMTRMTRNHGVIRLFFTTHNEAKLYYALEYCPHGDLYSLLEKIGRISDMKVLAFYMAQLITTVEFIHSKNILHRDIKPENLLLDAKFHLRIADFGSCTVEPVLLSLDGQTSLPKPAHRQSLAIGTPEYTPPEILHGKIYTMAADAWGIGCVMYQLLVGVPPFKGTTDFNTFQKIIKQEIVYPEGINNDAKDLISKFLTLDPFQRLGGKTQDYQTIKAHPFFQGIDWSTLYDTSPPIMSLSDRLEPLFKHDLTEREPEHNPNDDDDDDGDEENEDTKDDSI